MSRLQITLPIPKHATAPIRLAYFGISEQGVNGTAPAMFSSLGFTSDDGTPTGNRIPVPGSFTFLCSALHDSEPPHKQKVVVQPYNANASELARQLKQHNFQAEVV